MPVIFVWNAFGLHPLRKRSVVETTVVSAVQKDRIRATIESRQHDLSGRLQDAVLKVAELGEMQREDILIIFPEGQAVPPDVTLVSVDVLFAAAHRTREVREKLADALKKATLACYDQYEVGDHYRIEVAVKRFDTEADVYI